MGRYVKEKDGTSHVDYPDPEISYMEKFTRTGRIVPYGYAGDTMAVSSLLPVVGEAFDIPAAIVYKSTGGKTENTFWVWFDTDDKVVAYEWEFKLPAAQDSAKVAK